MRKSVLAAIPAAALAILALGGTAANADVTNNGTVNDAKGYATANHIHNGWSEDQPFNGDFHGIGHIRSTQTGSEIAAQGGHRVADVDPGTVNDQGVWGPISNKPTR